MNARDLEGETPLHSAAYSGHSEDIKTLLEAGADPNARDNKGNTPLHWAVFGGHAEAVTALLEPGVDLNARDSDGATPLKSAAYWGRSKSVKILLEAGADPNPRDDDWTPLHWATSMDARAVRDSPDTTPMERAAYWDRSKSVKILLEAGADPNARNNDGQLPFDYASTNERLTGTDAYWKLNDARFQ